MIKTLDNVTKPMMIAAATALAFALYCQVHSAIEAVPTPEATSLKWGASTGGPAGLLAWTIFALRSPLSAMAEHRPGWLVALGLVTSTVLAAGSAVLHLGVAAQASWDAGFVLELAYQRAPAALGFTGCVVAVALWRAARGVTPAAPPQSSRGGWIDFPGESRLRLRTEDVSFVRSAGNYCEVHSSGRTYLIRISLASLAKHLLPHGFVRIHRTSAVNMMKVRSFEPVRGSPGITAHLTCGTQLRVGRSYEPLLGTHSRAINFPGN